MEFLAEFGMFLLKAATIAIAVSLVLWAVIHPLTRAARPQEGRLRVTKLNDRLRAMARAIRSEALPPAAFKRVRKAEQRAQKEREKAAEMVAALVTESDAPRDMAQAGVETPGQLARGSGTGDASTQKTVAALTSGRRPRVYVLDFVGDLHASALESLREEITAILTVAEPGDEVVLRLDSGGGMMHAYGLAASQLARFRQRALPLTVCVDRIAASGGYLMACVADRIMAAPFAVVGSIGVVATVPNLHRLLAKHNIDVELHTAGQYKRTLTVLGENTAEGRAKFREQLEDAHGLFRDYLAEHRSSLDLGRVATGEHWHGSQGIGLGLVDELGTSDDLLLRTSECADLYQIRWERPKTIAGRLSGLVEGTVRRLARAGLQSAEESRYV